MSASPETVSVGRHRPFSTPIWYGVAAGIVALLVLADLASVGLVTMRHTSDLWFGVDSLWRSSLGQVPHLDFHSPVGQAFFWPYRFLSLFEDVSVLTLLHANALVGTMVAFLAVIGLWRRLHPPLFAAALLLLVATALSPRDIGFGFETFSHLANYNRWGWSLIALLSLMALLPVQEPFPNRRWEALDGVLIGIVAVLLFLLKITYFLGAVGLIAVAMLFRRMSLRMLLFCLTAFALTLVFVEFRYSNLSAYFDDLRAATAANLGAGVYRSAKTFWHVVEAFAYGGVAILVLWLLHPVDRLSTWVRAWWIDIGLVAVVLVLGAGLASQNHPTHESPLFHAGLILLLEQAWRRRPRAPLAARRRLRSIAAFAIAGVAIVWIPLIDAASVVAHAAFSRSGAACRLAAFEGTRLQAVMLPPRVFMRNGTVPAAGPCPANDDFPSQDQSFDDELRYDAMQISELMPALRTIAGSGNRILPFAFSNPFSAATNTPSPTGSLAWWHYGRTFSENAFPDAATLLRSVTIVAIPLPGLNPTSATEPMLQIYGSDLGRGFEAVSQLPHWTIMRKR